MSILKTYLANLASAIKEKKGIDTPINAKNFASEILSIQGGASLNLAYGETPPTDTSKIWLKCAEPSGVEVQNYLGECAVSDVANWGTIINPVSDTNYFYSGYFNSCYIGNNQIAIVGYNHIRIFDLTSKSYIADYTIGTYYDNAWYSNVLFKDNVLYFGYSNALFSFDLSTQTLNITYPGNSIRFISFYNDNFIYVFDYSSSSGSNVYQYSIINSTSEKKITTSNDFDALNLFDSNKVCINNTIYHFYYGTNSSVSRGKSHFKFSLLEGTFSDFTSLENFANAQGWTEYRRQSLVYDGERYVYLIGGTYIKSGETNSTLLNNIVRYDVINDTFELLGVSLLGAKSNHFSVLVDNRVYFFGGYTGNGDTRPNQIDYFDLSYPLPQNNAIITTNTINTDNLLPLINTEKLKLNSNIASAYKGNADNLAEKVNAYYWNGYGWVGINCTDYVESSGTGGGLNGGGGDVTTDPEIPVDKPVEI